MTFTFTFSLSSARRPWRSLHCCGCPEQSLNPGIQAACWNLLESLEKMPMSVPQPVSQSVSSVTQLCSTLCNPMNCSMPGFPVHHQLPKLVQTHVHCVSDAIQPSHPLMSPSPPAFSLSHHQGLFQDQFNQILSGGVRNGIFESWEILMCQRLCVGTTGA